LFKHYKLFFAKVTPYELFRPNVQQELVQKNDSFANRTSISLESVRTSTVLESVWQYWNMIEGN